VAEAGEQTYADALSKFFGAQVNGLTLMPVGGGSAPHTTWPTR
jgi:hypothetical protein